MTVSVPVDALASYHYFKDDKLAALVGHGVYRLIGDSGAYSAHTQGVDIPLADYARWCRRWEAHLEWCASLDVIGDFEASWRNWRELADTWGVNAVPTLHYGTDPLLLDRYAAQGATLVGLGGMVGRRASQLLPWLAAVMRHAQAAWPGVRFHGWGTTQPQVTNRIGFYSADSSGLTSSANRFGYVRVWDPRKRDLIRVRLDGRHAFRHSDLLRGVYGIEPSQVSVHGRKTRPVILAWIVASVQAQAAWLADRHRVDAPEHLSGAKSGTRLYIVEEALKYAELAQSLQGAPGPGAGP
jgi:hypothetical protein